MEEKNYLECNLPQSLQQDIDALLEGKYMSDLLEDEVYGSINAAEVEGEITSEQAWYLRKKYLHMIREE